MKIIRDCGCTITDRTMQLCEMHYKMIIDATRFKLLTGGDVDVELSEKFGVPVVNTSVKTWMKPEDCKKLFE